MANTILTRQPVAYGTGSITFSALDAVTAVTKTMTATGVKPGMIPIVSFAAALDDGMVLLGTPWVSANDTISFRFYNTTAAQIASPTAQTVNWYV